MSGLVAVLSRGGSDPEEAVRAGVAAAPHRGDPAGVVGSGAAAIGVARQPGIGDAHLAEADGWVAGVAGRIDNAPEIERRLRDAGNLPAATDPASIVLHAFKAWGDDAAGLFRGTYAIAATDGTSLWVFRDHLGLTTLFHRDDPNGFVAATEAKQVVASSGISLEPDLDVLEHIFYSTYDDETPSAIRGVSRQPKATLIRADARGARIRTYWHPDRVLETGRYADDEFAERFHAAMQLAVDRSLTGNGDVIALSGGVDSPALAAYAAPGYETHFGHRLAALSAVYPSLPNCDETPYIELVARDLDLELHTFERAPSSLEGLQDWVRLFDGPAPQWTVSQGAEFHVRAAERGFNNILTGEVAEFVIDMRHHLVDHLLLRGRIEPLMRYLRDLHERGYTWKGIYRQVLGALAPRPVLALYLRRKSPRDPFRPSWLIAQDPTASPQYGSYFIPPRERWRTGQLAGFNGPGLSMEADHIAQMKSGVRTRRPWADVDLWELFLSLPAQQKFADAESKGLARRLLRGRVPDAILDRTDKTTFNDYVMSTVDYPELRRWLLRPSHPVRGVDYARLAERLEAQDFTLGDYIWARDLAAVHAFQAIWD